MRRRDRGRESRKAGKRGHTLALVLHGIARVRVMGRLFRADHRFFHAVAGHRVMLGVGAGLDDRLFPGDEPGAMRRRRFHSSGEDEGYGERQANADQPLDHAAKMALLAALSI